MSRTFCWATMSWWASALAPASSESIFDTEIAAMTTSATIITPKAMPRRCASRRLLKRDMSSPESGMFDSRGPGGARRHRCHRPPPSRFECIETAHRTVVLSAGPGAGTTTARPENRAGPWEVQGRLGAVLGQCLADRLDDAVGLERLDDEVLGAELDRLEDLGLLAEGRAHHDAGRRVGGDDLGEGGEAVLLGHGDVQGHQVRLELLEARDRLDAVAGLADHLVAALRER